MENSKSKPHQMPNGHLYELFLDELRDLLDAEKQILKGLKKLASYASRPDLKKAFEGHYTETEGQIDRLKQVFAHLDLAPRGKKCKAIAGLLAEADEIIENFERSPILDAALIMAAQKVEHYEIASYGCLVTFAQQMKCSEAEKLLTTTLNEEKAADKKLTKLAEAKINLA